ncbi:hypothetical protein PHYBLDRAFT_171978 [Phycomyces blakesleeanus NRRL 1555(-)]|uniref:Uncharacterized protein n=1 Tax=Phycomyces blakesleeanus (strain ATCC 8743b / DSM 1359 / FGSC 10004 / NBRC 33097 / NRRL 1555) TaxID=763407 RepID=A0A167LA87_PHYB8|nr:hypothetical protein PHYBLDRAFT_171975 [Phycomyces blakesleeanus NRRL 1555(-)]XP_018287999.1 hypothetical protein PHYBLDRAFT_171978 [Phycomyces blakesleeanus NRRL 1555(-)]OAD69956.1 hypothetical protein PHYBLDRAFT_171975 [Phycomyces blakesleeanus NRRL 1555(-)]OAD69959.1 hypothetical protein PHYBLDRAFT_171978 [Phycomyces blakesleeanus NRRL 1555(-)]|eukprot:XP_018287996.1 hypothetical protein PHYBLDRAFT_171975 [Phycomyces blakesleeanus NRRL 1555(-)]
MHDHRIRTTDALLESHPHYGCVIRIASALRMRKLYLYLITLEKPLDYQMHYLKTINDYSFCDLLENKLFLSHMTTGLRIMLCIYKERLLWQDFVLDNGCLDGVIFIEEGVEDSMIGIVDFESGAKLLLVQG